MTTTILTSDRGILYAHAQQPLDGLPHRGVYVQRAFRGGKEVYWRATIVYTQSHRHLEQLVAEWNTTGTEMAGDHGDEYAHWRYELPHEPEQTLVASKLLSFIWSSQRTQDRGLDCAEIFSHPQLVQHGSLVAVALDGLKRHGYVSYDEQGYYCSDLPGRASGAAI